MGDKVDQSTQGMFHPSASGSESNDTVSKIFASRCPKVSLRVADNPPLATGEWWIGR